MGYSYDAERVEPHVDVRCGSSIPCTLIRCGICDILHSFYNLTDARSHGMSKTKQHGWICYNCKEKQR